MLDAQDISEVAGLRVTGVPLTVLEAAHEIGPKVLDDALLKKRVTLQELVAAHERYPRRPGAVAMATRLSALESGARSEAERRTVALFRGADIAGWVANETVCDHLADFVFDAEKVIVEIDGFSYHRDAKTFQRDRTKRNAWIAAGWIVLNFTWDDLTTRGDHVVAQVRAVIG